MRLGDLEEAIALADAELNRFETQNSSKPAWALRFVRADVLRLHGHVEEALSYLASCEEEYPPTLDDVISLANLKKTRGYCLGHLGRYVPSHALMKEAELIAKEAGLLELECEVYQCQAMIYYLQRDYTSSDQIFKRILDNSGKIGGWYFRANALWGIGKNLMIQEFFHAAIPWLEEALLIFEQAKALALIAVVWSELAVCHLGLGNDQKSLELLENALQIHRRSGRLQNYLVVLANIGNVYFQRNDFLRAIDYYRHALDIARQIKDPVSIQKWSYNIQLAYSRIRETVDELSVTTV